MKTLETLLTALNETKKERDELKLWLEQKEIVEYYEWKEENPKDRTAMDKVVAQLKMNDDNWLLKEKEYLEIKSRYDYLNSIYQTFLCLSSRSDIGLKKILNLVDNLLVERK